MLTRIASLLLILFSTLEVLASDEITQIQIQHKSSSNYSDNTSYKSVGLRQIENNRTTAPTNNDHESRITQFHEVFTNASVIKLSEFFANLIEVVYRQVKNCSYRKFDFPNQDTLFNILFQVIISPNAP